MHGSKKFTHVLIALISNKALLTILAKLIHHWAHEEYENLCLVSIE